MAEPEDVLAEGALHVTRLARELWARRTAGRLETPPGLTDLKRRLELFVAAVFPEAPDIGAAEPPAPLTFLARLAQRHDAHLHPSDAFASSDGTGIRLPGRLDDRPPSEIADRYRLLALEQAVRLHRGTLAGLPVGDILLGDLYLLAEAVSADAMLLRLFPRLKPMLITARLEGASMRPLARRPSPVELEVERMLLDVLAADPLHPPSPFAITQSPEASRRWAEQQRQRLTGKYRGMAPVPVWGTIADAGLRPATGGAGGEDESSPRVGRTRTLPRRPRPREAGEEEDDREPGTWMVRADDLQEKAEDPAGLQRPADRDQQADPGELADALSELPEARLVRTPERVAEVLAGEGPLPRGAAAMRAAEGIGLAYPEWDWRANGYRPRAAVVRERMADAGSMEWVDLTLRRHGAQIRAVRRDFERLRPRRTALGRQRDGAELDLDALVAAYADRRGGGVQDDRCYVDTRPVRRDAAIALLVDASASTDGWVSGTRRILDVEKEALLIVGEALAALGDAHAMVAFASAGPARVTLQVLKGYDEPAASGVVRRRIAGLESDGYTRAGAALRHVTAGLLRQPFRHRLLLLLSDGRPNDVDEYEGRYGIEDTRMAVAEARLQGVHVFCLTVDRQAPRYAARIFGRDFAVLSRAERLPGVLTALLRGLVRA